MGILDTSSLQVHEEAVEMPSLMDTFVNIFPSNSITLLASTTMFHVIVMSLFMGFGIIMAEKKGNVVAEFIHSISEVFVKIMGIILKLSPIDIFALITSIAVTNGISVSLPLLKLIMVTYVASMLHVLIVYLSTVKFID